MLLDGHDLEQRVEAGQETFDKSLNKSTVDFVDPLNYTSIQDDKEDENLLGEGQTLSNIIVDERHVMQPDVPN